MRTFGTYSPMISPPPLSKNLIYVCIHTYIYIFIYDLIIALGRHILILRNAFSNKHFSVLAEKSCHGFLEEEIRRIEPEYF